MVCIFLCLASSQTFKPFFQIPPLPLPLPPTMMAVPSMPPAPMLPATSHQQASQPSSYPASLQPPVTFLMPHPMPLPFQTTTATTTLILLSPLTLPPQICSLHCIWQPLWGGPGHKIGLHFLGLHGFLNLSNLSLSLSLSLSLLCLCY